MSEPGFAERLPPSRRVETGAWVSGLTYDRTGRTLGVACGDGRVWCIDTTNDSPPSPPEPAHRGVSLSIIANPSGDSFISGGDDGRLLRHGDAARELESFKGRWFERLAGHTKTATLAAVAGKEIVVYGASGRRVLGPHPSTVADIDFSPDGSRLVAAHYGGVTIHVLKPADAAPRSLEWKGSHVAVRYSPDARFIATGTQDNALHVWRLATGKDMQMSGYPVKVKQLAWSHDARFLFGTATSLFTGWPFAGKGPEGKPPIQFGDEGAGIMTAIAAHAADSFIAAGFDTGEVQVGDSKTRRSAVIKLAGDGQVSALAWSPGGWSLAVGTDQGVVELIDLRR
ncbi:MAG: WD40 repeat domain-containing protein [Alphaproteobacteria bacterium]|nr:WD40 repeat domain-containing protein [Alphaproteobacteria bacterium]